MNNDMNIDLGEETSRDLGNVAKTLVDIGKEVVKNSTSEENVDYGSLPSRALTQLGKQAVANSLNENNLQ